MKRDEGLARGVSKEMKRGETEGNTEKPEASTSPLEICYEAVVLNCG